jgi:RimJ/RimL family protein N-acetyltransferase
MIETERLILRRLTAADIAEMVVIQSDPELIRFLGPVDTRTATEWLTEVDRNWTELGYGRLGIVERASGRLVGRSGIMFVEQFAAPELGWTLRRECWGRGYAIEAARACLRWSFGELGLTRTISLIERTNARSLSVARRLGMTPGEPVTYYERPMILHEITREAGGS